MASDSPAQISPDEITQFAVLLFTDICDSTALKSQHGAMAYKRAAELHNALFEKIAAEEKLTLIKNTGDGYFARTTSVAAAVRFALRFQYGMQKAAWPSFPLTTRVGIHAGEVADITTLGQADVLAPAADLVARVMGLAVGGQILLTRSPFDEARHFVREHPDAVAGLSLTWLAHGPYLFKGCGEPVEVFEVGATACAPLIAPPDGEKARRALRPGDEETLGWRPACGLEVPGRAGWVLARKIGEGGFGEVWLAEQATTKQRRVFKFCFDEDRLRSFKRELTFFRLIRDALGERPDIARLYDVKLDAPPFFLESEFAEHGNLVEWCEKQGGIGAVPLPRRIELVAQIAEAVAAAHSVGILHKDLKPQNVLMQTRPGGGPAPQITDFGIGALADDAALSAHAITAAGFTVNTLVSRGSSMTRLYAPPEQLTGKVFTVQGDVYALGVMLYQMAIGDFTRALAPGWEREVKDDILREDLAECLDGEPARRLASVAELAERLRSLEQRRAEATRQREAEGTEAARKKRQRTLTFATTAAVLIAAITIPLTVWALSEKGKAEKASVLADTRLALAKQTRDAAEDLISESVRKLREKLLALGKVDVMEDMVGTAGAYFQRLPAELKTKESERNRAALAMNRALIATALGKDEEHERFAKESLAITEQLLLAEPDNSELQREATYAMLNLTDLEYSRAAFDSVISLTEQVFQRCDQWLQTHPQSPWALYHLVLAHDFAGQVFVRRKLDAITGAIHVKKAADAAARLRQAAGETPETCEAEGLIHYANAKMATLLELETQSVSEMEAAAASFARAIELGGENALRSEQYAGAIHHAGAGIKILGTKSKDDAKVEKGMALLLKALEIRTRLVNLEPGRAEWWRDLAWSNDFLGGSAQTKGDLTQWLQRQLEAVRMVEEAIKRHPTRPNLYDDLAGFLGRVSDAYERQQPPQLTNAAQTSLRALRSWREALEKSQYEVCKVSMRGTAEQLMRCAMGDPVNGANWLAEARGIIEPALEKLRDKGDSMDGFKIILRAQELNFTTNGKAADAASVKALLESLPK